MSQEFNCPHCGVVIALADGSSTSSVCPHCGAEISHPTVQPAPAMTPVNDVSYTTEKTGKLLYFWSTRAVICGVSLVALLISLILIGVGGQRELARRTVCANRLKSIAYSWSVDGRVVHDYFLISDELPSGSLGVGNVDYTRAIGAYRGLASDDTAGDVTLMNPRPDHVSTVRLLWLRIREEASIPEDFICPSTQDRLNQDVDPRVYWDFGVGDVEGDVGQEDAKRNYAQVSYGVQVPYGMKGKPSADRDQRMAIAADKGPFGVAIELGGHVGPVTASDASSQEEWKPWNSPNHEGEGQNILYADSHVEFQNTPNVGMSQDNIYTQWSGPSGDINSRVQGAPPTLGGKETPMDDYDSLIYP